MRKKWRENINEIWCQCDYDWVIDLFRIIGDGEVREKVIDIRKEILLGIDTFGVSEVS